MRRDPEHPKRPGRFWLAGLLAAASLGWVGNGTSAASPPAELISVDPATGAPFPPNQYNTQPSVSGDGNIVVFNSDAFTTTTVQNVFVRNRSANTTTAVPLPPSVPPITNPTEGVVSRDGCHVAFWGFFGSLVAASRWIVFTWNRCAPGVSAATIVSLVGVQPGPLAISADGRYIAYIATLASGAPPVIGRVDTNAPMVNSPLAGVFANANSIDISDDGKFVAVGGQRSVDPSFTSQVLGWTPPCANSCTTEVISVGSSGQPAAGSSNNPSVSVDGRYAAFSSYATDIVPGIPPPLSSQVYVRDRAAGVTKLVTDTPGQPLPAELGVNEPDISPDGTQIALSQTDGGETSEVWVARSTSGYFDAALFDLVSYGVSGNPVGGPGANNPSMSSTGRFVAFASSASDELAGVPPAYTQTWMRSRPIQLGITPAIDFGTVDIAGQSPPKNAVITNTSAAEINLGAVTVPGGPFSITVNTCVGVLPAGATCVVTMVFRPTAAGPASSTLTVTGDGLSVSTSLTGTGRTPTGPTPGFLTINPVSANYGKAVVGTSLPAKKFVVTNPGQTAVTVTSVGLGGVGADQFAIDSNGCSGSLAPGASCTIQVSATVIRDGTETATLDVLGSGGQSAHGTLRIGGEFTPELKMNPGVVSAGGITVAIGSGFPPNIDVQLAFEGEAPFATVHTEPDGAFRYNYLLLRNGVHIGGRQVVVLDQAEFGGVRAPLLIDLATYRPSGFSSPAITSGVRSLVTRGG